MCATSCNGGEYCACKKRPDIYSDPLPPWPTLEEIRKAIRDELRKAGFEPEARTAPPSGRAGVV